MKKLCLGLPLFFILFLAGCADDPSKTGITSMSRGSVQVTLDQTKTGFTIAPSQVTNAVITLTGPTGTVQTAVWKPGDQNVFYFHADITGAYVLNLTQTDTSNQTYSTNFNLEFVAGFNYYITASLGGYVTVTVGTNVSSASSSVSSTVSSASSVSSSSISSSISSSSSSLSSSRSSSSTLSSVSSASSVSSTASSSSSAPISGIQATDITSYTAIIRWTTAVPSSSQVLYGLDDWLPFATAVDTNLVTNHAVMLINLIPWGHYYYKARSVDAVGNVFLSGLLSFDTPIDMTPPVISSVRSSNITSSSVTILWNTDEPGDSQVDCWYWEGSSRITLSRYTSDKVWSHQITVTGLPSAKTITYNVTSMNGAGMSATSGNYTFTTP